MMKYNYEFRLNGNEIVSIKRWNLFSSENINPIQIVNSRNFEDWSDIFSCKVFMSNNRIIFYNEKFSPVTEEEWFRYKKLNNIAAISRIANCLDLSLSSAYKSDWENSYLVYWNNHPIVFDRLELRESRFNQRTYIVLNLNNLFIFSEDSSDNKYDRYVGLMGRKNTFPKLGKDHKFILYPLTFSNFCEDSWYCANPPLGFTDGKHSEGKFYNMGEYCEPRKVLSSVNLENNYENVSIINSFDTITDESTHTQLYTDDLSRGIRVHIHDTGYFPRILDLSDFNILLT